MQTDYNAAVQRVLASEESNVVELVKVAGLDPTIAFRSGDWRNCDFSGSDLRNFDFSFADLTGASFDGAWTRGARFHGAKVDQGALSRSIDHTMGGEAKGEHFESLALALNANTLMRKLRKAQSVASGIEVIREILQAGIALNAKHFSILLDKARSKEDIDTGWRAMDNFGVTPDSYVYASRIEHAHNFLEASDYFDQMLSRGIEADRIVLTQLAQKTTRATEIMDLIERCKFNDFDDQLANKILEVAESREELLRLINKFRDQWKFEPNYFTLGVLIAKSDKIGEVLSHISGYSNIGAKVSIETFEKCISAVRRFDSALRVLDWAIHIKTRVHINTITTVLAKAASLREAEKVLVRARQRSIKLNSTAATALLARVDDFDEAWKLFNNLTIAIDPNLQMFTALVRVSSNFTQVRTVLEKVSALNIVGDANFYAAVLKKAPDLPVAIVILDDIVDRGVKLNSNVLDAAMGCAKDFEEANTLLMWMQKRKVYLDANLFMSFLSLAPDYGLARQIFSRIGGASAVNDFEAKQMLGRS